MKPGLTVILIAIYIMSGGCMPAGQKTIKTNFYTFEYDQPETQQKDPLPYALRIERFQISPLYDTDKVVFREKKFLRDKYNYHRWMTNPRDLVTYYLTRDIRDSNSFKAVYSYENPYPASYTLAGTIDEMYENDGTGWEAVLSLSVILLKENEPDASKRVIFQKSYSERKQCSEKNPTAVVEAMGNAMSAISKQITGDIHQCLLKTR